MASKDEKGFTLIEAVLVIILMAIIAAGFGQMFITSATTYATADSRKEALQDVRWALDRMSREIRLVNDNTVVTTATATTFAFTDVNSNAVTFSYDGAANRINRGADVLAENVDVYSFTYLDNTGTPLADCPPPPCASPTAIWRVQMNAETLVNGERVILRTEVHPRNF